MDPAIVKLRAVRKALRSLDLAGLLVPNGDAHQSEYLAERDKRREWISGFTGSNGTALILNKPESAHLWTDGRYIFQAGKELNPDLWTLHKDEASQIGEFITKTLNPGSRIGVDPFHISNSQYQRLEMELHAEKFRLIPLERNVIDEVWGESQPPMPNQPILSLGIEYTGMSLIDKVSFFREEMKKKKCGCLILSDLAEIAYTFNLRGSDIPHNPVFFSFAAITYDDVYLFLTDPELLDIPLNGVIIKPYNAIGEFIKEFKSSSDCKIWFSEHASRGLIANIPQENNKIISVNPVSLKKAVKNETEMKGFVNCHIRDAVALCRYFAWLEKEIVKKEVDEFQASQILDSFRKEMDDFVGTSFPTISGSGPNAAIIHYRPKPGKSKVLTRNDIYLVDSGGQYKDGTTDVTRTVHFGSPSDRIKECFTRVLKGQIRLTQTVFPKGVKGYALDSIARSSLWQVGLDYAHGTGHGVGSYLNVHEGPMGISKRYNSYDPGLEKGMVLSIEPGYYEDGNFGIRIENLVQIVRADTENNFGQKEFLTFENLTLVPIQKKLIEPTMLSSDEVAYIDDYHTLCKDRVGPLLRELGLKEALNWLIRETEPLG
ncbi:LOW QUALITY PROTEIN: xaa-Pro aminopeptidase 1 [Lepeophtheirus salmonis]|uniref:Uncharacterized protein n=1 Tax=Lepeophtheirus salmonis TaxID=72036 RepID=A0A0K2UEY0_LEPSM|nr:LOW QUALITY PROTEIN: xaa-Pro aminopeptidase 1-like [Lepeophtheirus salmonis]